MSFQIVKIILYSYTGKIRTISFRINSVNIITGASGTGKSALIHIVNYCLGQKKSTIPENVIMKHVSWFAVHLVRDKEELFVARRNPGPGKSSSEEIYIERGHNLDIPDYNTLNKNTNLDGLIMQLNGFSGITEYSFDPKLGHTRKTGKANIGKALIYCFQEQSEVAHQHLLFHRQGEERLPQSIRDYMPFFLGVIDKEHIYNKEELRSKKRELKIIENQITERERLKGTSFARAHALIAEAVFVGLIPTIPQMPQSWVEVKEVLTNSVNSRTEKDIPEGQYTNELNRLFEKQQHLRYNSRTARDEIAALQVLKSGGNGFAQESNEQRARLKSIDLLPIDEKANHHICPFCSSALENPIPNSQAIHTNLQKISEQLDGVTSDISHIEQMIALAESKRIEANSDLQSVNTQIQTIQQINQQIEEIRDLNVKRALVKGRLGLYLETITNIEDETADNSDIERLKSRIQNLGTLLDDDALEGRLRSVLSIISGDIADMALKLNLEYSKHPIRLDSKKLTVVADTESGMVPLERMGSGETWVSLHLITHLALHHWFARKNIPVPRFVFFDQPTQTYYPPDEMGQNTDRDSVIQTFKLISERTNNTGFQVIIIEHADIKEDWYQQMISHKWWDGKTKLVPLEWIEDN